MKKCGKCKKTLEWSEFDKNPSKSDGLNGTCKKCRSARVINDRDRKAIYAQGWVRDNRERDQRNKVEWNKKNPGYFRDLKLKKYGLTTEKFEALLEAQGHACAICRHVGKLNIDHDHATGKVRALLCHKCNAGIGLLNESPELLRVAANYLEKIKLESQSPMKKLLNRLLKFVGINIVKAKKTRAPRKSKPCIPSPTCCVDEYNAGKTLKPFNPAPVTAAELRDAGKTPHHVHARPTQHGPGSTS